MPRVLEDGKVSDTADRSVVVRAKFVQEVGVEDGKKTIVLA